MKSFFNKKPYFIAEVGVNHECNFKTAIKQIDLVKKGRCDCVKFQFYKAENLVIKKSPYYWDLKEEKVRSQYELFKKFDQFEIEQMIELSKYSKSKKLDFSCSIFDLDSFEILQNYVDFIKIASADLTFYDLLKSAALSKKPVVLSTGASNLEEIQFAVSTLDKYKAKEIILLHCILQYPTPLNKINLSKILFLKKKFSKLKIGLSDHTKPDNDLVFPIAYSLGATIFEKHFTHNKKLKGNDHYHAGDYKDFLKFRDLINLSKRIIGNFKNINFLNSEKKSRLNARRSLFYRCDLKKGTILKRNQMISKRPGNGTSPILIETIIGKKLKINVMQDQYIKMNHIE